MAFYNHRCSSCGSTATIVLTSTDQILCADCRSYSDYRLKPGQQSVLIEGKVGDIREDTNAEVREDE